MIDGDDPCRPLPAVPSIAVMQWNGDPLLLVAFPDVVVVVVVVDDDGDDTIVAGDLGVVVLVAPEDEEEEVDSDEGTP